MIISDIRKVLKVLEKKKKKKKDSEMVLILNFTVAS